MSTYVEKKIKREKIEKPKQTLKNAQDRLTDAIEKTRKSAKHLEKCWVNQAFEGDFLPLDT